VQPAFAPTPTCRPYLGCSMTVRHYSSRRPFASPSQALRAGSPGTLTMACAPPPRSDRACRSIWPSAIESPRLVRRALGFAGLPDDDDDDNSFLQQDPTIPFAARTRTHTLVPSPRQAFPLSRVTRETARLADRSLCSRSRAQHTRLLPSSSPSSPSHAPPPKWSSASNPSLM
jgi:hypothetical protein